MPDTCYIDFLNKDKNFQKDRVTFESYEKARVWGFSNLENFNPDFIKFF